MAVPGDSRVSLAIRVDPERPCLQGSRSFLNNEHSHTAYAKALYQALKASRINDKFQEPLFLALELIRSGVLHSGKYGGVVMSGGPDIGDGRLISLSGDACFYESHGVCVVQSLSRQSCS